MSGERSLPSGSRVLPIQMRLLAGTLVDALSWDPSTATLIVGNTFSTVVFRTISPGGGYAFRIGSGQLMTVNASGLTMQAARIAFAATSVTAPVFGMDPNPAVVVGQPVTFSGQNTNGTGGDVSLQPGAGAGTPGAVAAVRDELGNAKLTVSTVGMGFYGAAPQAKPSITGSRVLSDPVALSILAAGTTLGLWTDNTTP